MELIRKTTTRRYKPTSLRSLQKELSGPVTFCFFENISPCNIDAPLSAVQMLQCLTDACHDVDHFLRSLFQSGRLTSYSQDLMSTSFKMLFFKRWFGKRMMPKPLVEETLSLFWATGIDKRRVSYSAYNKKVALGRFARIYPSTNWGSIPEIDRMMDHYTFSDCEEGIQYLKKACKKEAGDSFPLQHPNPPIKPAI